MTPKPRDVLGMARTAWGGYLGSYEVGHTQENSHSDAIRDTWYLGGGSVRLNYTHMQYGINGRSGLALCVR